MKYGEWPSKFCFKHWELSFSNKAFTNLKFVALTAMCNGVSPLIESVAQNSKT